MKPDQHQHKLRSKFIDDIAKLCIEHSEDLDTQEIASLLLCSSIGIAKVFPDYGKHLREFLDQALKEVEKTED